jgi:nitroreductase
MVEPNHTIGRPMAQVAVSTSPPKSMDVFEAMRRRRMHRLFTDEPVSRQLLEKLVYAASRAQAARAGMRHLLVVSDRRLVATLRQMCPGFINNAPAAIVICSDVERSRELVGVQGPEEVARFDAGGAAGYLALAAPALGLGICVVTSWNDAAVRTIFALPEHIRPEIVVAVGHPVPNPPRGVKRFEPIVHENRFGEAWLQEA